MRRSWKVFVVFTVMATVLAIPGVALAHHPGIAYDPDCLLGDGSFEFTYTITAETSVGSPPEALTNPAVEVWISYDGGAPFLDQTGAFTLPDLSFSGGPLTAPAGTATVTILADPVAPWGDGTPPLGDDRTETFAAPTELCFENPGTGTPGYWHKIDHWEDWGIEGVTIGGDYYTAGQAINLINMPVKGDKRNTMFPALVAAKLNVMIGNDDSCIADTIAAADAWWADYGDEKVKANSDAWKAGEPLYWELDAYNNGYLCAPHRD